MTKFFDRPCTGREDQLQFLRFFAFMNVFTLHIGDWRFFEYPAWNGAVSAVTFFFMLSGMLTGYNAYGKNTKVSLRAIGIDIYRKIRKLYPLYFLTTYFTVFFFNIPASIIHDFENTIYSLIHLLRHILLLQSWFPDGYFSYNGVGWYLSTLLFLYLLNLPMTAVLNRIGKKKNGNRILLFLIIFLTLATIGYSYLTYTSDAHFLQYVFPPARIGQYLIGMIAGNLLHTLKEKLYTTKSKRNLFTIAEVAALVFWVGSLYQPIESWYNRLVSWILPNLCLISVFALGQGWLSALFRLKPFVRLGDVSFECYLLHQNIIYLLGQVAPNSRSGRLLCIVLSLSYTLLLAFFHKQKVEKTHKVHS